MVSTTKKVELIGNKEFMATALNPDYKTFIIYIATLNISFNASDKIHPLKSAQITHLKADKVL